MVMKKVVYYLCAVFEGLALVSVFSFLIALGTSVYSKSPVMPGLYIVLFYFVFLIAHEFYLISAIILFYWILFHKSFAKRRLVAKAAFLMTAAAFFSCLAAQKLEFEKLTWCNLFLSCLLSALTLMYLFEKRLRHT